MSETTHSRATGRREDILEAALRDISANGVAEVTHRTIAKAAGVPVGSLTYYFESKEQLILQALGVFVAHKVTELNGIEERLETQKLTLDEALDAIVAAITADHDSGLNHLELYLEARRHPVLSKASRRCSDAFARVARAALESAGRPAAQDQAVPVIALCDGLALHAVPTDDWRAPLHRLLGV